MAGATTDQHQHTGHDHGHDSDVSHGNRENTPARSEGGADSEAGPFSLKRARAHPCDKCDKERRVPSLAVTGSWPSVLSSCTRLTWHCTPDTVSPDRLSGHSAPSRRTHWQ